jgi:predicted nucleic acid-binding protein
MVASLFEGLDSGVISAVTSAITVAEVVVLPLRLGRSDLSQQYLDLLLKSLSLDVLPIDVHVAQVAAELRARFRVRLPDALQLAVAIAAGCDAFLTNDVALKQVTDIRVITLADLLG